MKALAIARRNILLFFRDKASVFFSLLSALIVIALYALFLRGTFASSADINLMDLWLMCGVIGISGFTTALGATEVLVRDKYERIISDFATSPLRRRELTLGYLLSTLFIGGLLSLITIFFAQVYIIAAGGEFLGFWPLVQILAVNVLSVVSASALVVFIVSFIKTTNAFSVLSIIIGTLIGFVTCTYMPMNIFPHAARFVVKIFPVSHTISLFRQITMNARISALFPDAAAAAEFKEEMGVVFTAGGHNIAPLVSILFLAGTAVLFFALSVYRLSKKQS